MLVEPALGEVADAPAPAHQIFERLVRERPQPQPPAALRAVAFVVVVVAGTRALARLAAPPGGVVVGVGERRVDKVVARSVRIGCRRRRRAAAAARLPAAAATAATTTTAGAPRATRAAAGRARRRVGGKSSEDARPENGMRMVRKEHDSVRHRQSFHRTEHGS